MFTITRIYVNKPRKKKNLNRLVRRLIHQRNYWRNRITGKPRRRRRR